MKPIPIGLFQSAPAVRQYLRKCRNLPASVADACLICLAEHFNTGDVLTLDRHFTIYRWRKTRPFHVLVERQE